MLRHMPVAFALGFVAIALHGCELMQSAKKVFHATRFLNRECENSTQEVLAEHRSDELASVKKECSAEPEEKQAKCEDEATDMLDKVIKLVGTTWTAKCIGHVMHDLGGKKMMKFNESNTEIDEKVDAWVESNKDDIKHDVSKALRKIEEGKDMANVTVADTLADAFEQAEKFKQEALEKAQLAEQACDASEAPSNGGVGDCTDQLATGSSCQPTCDDGYTSSGASSCDEGTLTAATCVKITTPEPTASNRSASNRSTSNSSGDNRTRLFETVHDTDSEKPKTMSTSAAVLAGAGVVLIAFGAVICLKVGRQSKLGAGTVALVMISGDSDVEDGSTQE